MLITCICECMYVCERVAVVSYIQKILESKRWPVLHALEKEMATYSSVLAWRIPGMGEPGGLRSVGSHIAGHDWSNLAAAAAAPYN